VVINLRAVRVFRAHAGPGREALITAFARVERGGQLAPISRAYTRNLTWPGASFS